MPQRESDEVESEVEACQADLVKDQNNGVDFPGADRQQTSANGRVLTGWRPNLAAFYPEQNGNVGTMLRSSVINISEALCRIRVARWLQAAPLILWVEKGIDANRFEKKSPSWLHFLEAV